VGEPRIMMQKQLSRQECDFARSCWENGLPEAVITYELTLPERRSFSAEAGFANQRGFAAVRQTTDGGGRQELKSPLGVARADIRKGLILTKLGA
jgi:hypothetical protein